MTDTNDTAVRAALLQLGARSSATADLPLPLLLRAPAIALLWATLVVVLVSLLALSRIRLPHTARGVAVSVHTGADSTTLMMLLPAAVQPYVRPGQRATLDVGNARPLVLHVAHVDSALLDASGARRQFPHASHIFAHLQTPKVAATLAPCTAGPACLTPSVGSVYAAAASLGTRSLASYAWSGTPPPAR